MAVQTRQDFDGSSIFRYGVRITTEGVIAQDGGRSTDLVQYTLMGKLQASGKWVPFTDETATDGTGFSLGIYIGEDILAADLVAGDISDAQIIIAGSVLILDESFLTIENSKTLDTKVENGTKDFRTIEEKLQSIGIYFTENIHVTNVENS